MIVKEREGKRSQLKLVTENTLELNITSQVRKYVRFEVNGLSRAYALVDKCVCVCVCVFVCASVVVCVCVCVLTQDDGSQHLPASA